MILQEICANKKKIIKAEKTILSLAELKNSLNNNHSKSLFLKNIEAKIASKKLAIIAEIKQKSPSKGILIKNFDLAKIARSYEKGGAVAMSILTDYKYFAGKNEYLKLAKKHSSLPILRKDFIVDEYQIYQSKLIGADAILLIMSILTLDQAKEYEEIASNLGLDILVESHNEKELEQALNLKTKLIGINNRNLKNLDISLDNIEKLRKFIPNDKIAICESGIGSLEDFRKIKKSGINSFLIGHFLIKQQDPALILRQMNKKEN